MVSRNRDVTKRMNFFDRQFLRAQDFADEQDYHLDRRHRHNRLLHSSGIADGLEVTSQTSTTVQIGAGMAIDNLGREIILLEPHELTVNEDVTIYLSYPDAEPLADESSDPGVTGFTRVHEAPVLTRVPTDASAQPPQSLALASVVLSGGNVTDLRQFIETGSAMLEDGSVTSDKLDTHAVIGPKLAVDAVTQTKIKDGAVSIAKLKRDKVLDTTVTVNANGEPTYVSIETRSDHAFYLISVFPVTGSSSSGTTKAAPSQGHLRWQQVMSPIASTSDPQVEYQVELVHTGSVELDVEVVVYRVNET